MSLRFRVVLVTAVAVCGGLTDGVASAALGPKTSVTFQFASHKSFKRGLNLGRELDRQWRDDQAR